MAKNRRIRKVFRSKPTIEGAGVHLKRAFGFSEVPALDPFLLLDDFRSNDPKYFIKGFPWHPHRGIETITYVLGGDVEHGDSMGNKGIIGSGRCAMDDCGQRHNPSGNAQGRQKRTHGWFSVVGESACLAQDDGPALSRHNKQADTGNFPTTVQR